jgi:hypothetical protein
MSNIAPESTIYRIAADMVDLSEKMIEVGIDHGDTGLADDGFKILEMARYLITDHLEYMNQRKGELNAARERADKALDEANAEAKAQA